MTAISATSLKFGLGLHTADLDRAVEFYSALFGCGPVKCLADYAEFTVDDPPLVLSVSLRTHSPGGVLNHVGFRVETSDELVAVQHRLELAGISTQREEGAECCYARQTKFWVSDPDGNLWEVYTLEEDLDHSGFGGDDASAVSPSAPVEAASVVWGHRLTEPRPTRIAHEDDSVDEAHLEGTFNADWPAGERRSFLNEVVRVLRPGGVVAMRALVADVPFPGRPQLPGPAMVVERVPREIEPVAELSLAGLTGIQIEQRANIHCFQVQGVELHDLRLSAVKPFASNGSDRYEVLYRGPLAEVIDDGGRTYPRGQRVAVDRSTWELFQSAGFSAHFTCFPCNTSKEQ